MTSAPRTAWPASRWSCILTVSLVFLTGALAGAVAFHLGGSRVMRRSPAPFWTEAGKDITVQKWKQELHLNAAQTQELEAVLDDFGLYYRNVVSEIKPRILRILDDEQKRKFDKLLNDSQQGK